LREKKIEITDFKLETRDKHQIQNIKQRLSMNLFKEIFNFLFDSLTFELVSSLGFVICDLKFLLAIFFSKRNPQGFLSLTSEEAWGGSVL